MPPFCPRMVGLDFYPRYVIVDGESRYWTGYGWSRRLGQARVFFDFGHVERAIARLMCSSSN